MILDQVRLEREVWKSQRNKLVDEMITWYRQLNDGVKSLIKFLSLALVVGVICVIIINFFYAPMLVSGDSMRPALSDDDIIIIDKVTYRSEDP